MESYLENLKYYSTELFSIGIHVSAIVASLGLTGFAIGFAFKDALSNYLAGIMVILYKPYDIRDNVNITGVRGK